MALHDREELDDDLGRRADEDLALAAALRVDNVVLRIQVSFKLEETHMMNVPDSRSCKDTRVSEIIQSIVSMGTHKDRDADHVDG